ncbi:MAG: PEP-CTERM sorting domain-containing protein [Planctomycetes bacterium]|nr:PEP-CTERM sorting domain-containing protein [Planctomycetota bacterium]
MRSSRCLVLFFAAALVLKASTSFGAIVTDSGPFSFPLSPNSAIVALDLFNPALGTLNFVELAIDGTVQANVTAENDSAIAGNMSVNLTGILDATAFGLSAAANIIQAAGPVAVAATDGVSGSGPDFNDFGLVSGTDSDTDLTLTVGSFIGPGTFNANVDGSGGFSISGVTDSTLQISSFEGFGTVTVTYNYTPIPEPGTLALGALALVGMASLRKRHRLTV